MDSSVFRDLRKYSAGVEHSYRGVPWRFGYWLDSGGTAEAQRAAGLRRDRSAGGEGCAGYAMDDSRDATGAGFGVSVESRNAARRACGALRVDSASGDDFDGSDAAG